MTTAPKPASAELAPPDAPPATASAPAALADVTVTGWLTIHPDGESADPEVASWFDPATRRGLSVNLVSGGGGYSSQGDEVRLSVGIDHGTEPVFEDLGAPNPESRYVSNSLTVFDGELYAATTDAATPDGYAHVYRHVEGQEWLDLGRPPGVDARGIGAMVAHRGGLYVAAWTYDWTRVGAWPLGPVHVYRLLRDGGWEDCGPIGGAKRVFGMASYAGDLYVSADDDHVYRFTDGTWVPVRAFTGYPHPMHVFQGRLWVGTVDPGELWSFDGETWYDEGNPEPDPADASQLHSFARPGGRLAVGTWPHGRVRRRDDAEWTLIGAPDGATEINGLQMYNGALYAGALPYAELSRYDGGRNWTTLRRFNQPSAGTLVDIAASGWRSRQEMAAQAAPASDDSSASNAESDSSDDFMRDWGRVTSMVEHDGRLMLSTGNSTSSYDDCPEKTALGRVFAMSTGTVATSPQAIAAGRHHVAAVRAGGRVQLYIDGQEAAAASGELTAAIAMTPQSRRRTSGLSGADWHDRALTGQEIATLYAAGPSV